MIVLLTVWTIINAFRCFRNIRRICTRYPTRRRGFIGSMGRRMGWGGRQRLENWGRQARKSLSRVSQLRVMPSRLGGFLCQLTTTSWSASSPVRSIAGCALPARAMISLTDGRSSSWESEGGAEGKEFLSCWKHIEAIGIKSPLHSRLRRLRKERKARETLCERDRIEGLKRQACRRRRSWVLIAGTLFLLGRTEAPTAVVAACATAYNMQPRISS